MEGDRAPRSRRALPCARDQIARRRGARRPRERRPACAAGAGAIAAREQQSSKADVHITVPRIDREGAAIGVLSAIPTAGRFIRGAEAAPRADVAGVERDALLERRSVAWQRVVLARGGRRGIGGVFGAPAERAEKQRQQEDRPGGGDRAARGHRHSATYQSRSGRPTVAAAAAPSARKVPNGSAYFMLPAFEMISARPTIVT